jgi:selenocysteine lyase/cysteine desulfurase
MMPLYLDNAATSFPKPGCVLAAMVEYAGACGAPSRGVHGPARAAAGVVLECRRRMALLLGAPSAEHVVFTLNTSDALNMALKGVVLKALSERERVHVVTTALDHNSVLRPLNALCAQFGGRVTQTRVPIDAATGVASPGAVGAAMTPETVLVAVNHASNVNGAVQDAGAVGRVCRERGVLFLLDAAQSLGHVPVDMGAMHVDLCAFPGHKGALGPTGTGGLAMLPGVEREMVTLREGGTGTRSEVDTQPEFMPDRFEPGSHNTIGLAGLNAAAGWLLDRSVAALRVHEVGLIGRVLSAFEDAGRFPGMTLLGPKRAGERVGVFSVVHGELSGAALATELESRFGILTRPGVHCAPLAHQALTGGRGACRFSLGPFVTEVDVDRCLAALSMLAREAEPVVRGTVPAGRIAAPAF